MLWRGFQKPKRLASDAGTLTDKYGMFWAQPFERGFGTTIGNALRRVLLSRLRALLLPPSKSKAYCTSSSRLLAWSRMRPTSSST